MTSFANASKKVKKLKKDIRDKTGDALEESMEDVERQLKWKIKQQGSDATGTLRRSIESDTDTYNGPVVAHSQITGAYHWKYLEYGTGRGSPYPAPDHRAPYAPIYRWIVAKGITPRPGGPYDTQAELAAAIQYTVGTGTHSNPFVRPIWRGNYGRSHVANSVGDALNDAVDSF